MNHIRHFVPVIAAVFALSVVGNTVIAAASKVHHHHDMKQLLGEKAKQDGRHEIDHKGKYTTSVEVKGGKIAALHVKHAEKGEIPVKKYKTHRKMVQTGGGNLVYVSYRLAQLQDLGTEYIGYAYVDEYGNEEIYWVLVEEVYDGDTGAIEYIPLTT
jgi:hypothetical protein